MRRLRSFSKADEPRTPAPTEVNPSQVPAQEPSALPKPARRTDSRRAALHRMAEAGILTAAAMILSYLEAVLPFSVGVPGVKLGLCHIVTVFALYRLTPWETAAVTLVRVLLSALLFGSAASLAYSLTGAVLSLIVMLLLRRAPVFSPTGVSVAGGVAHNVGQLACAALLMGTVRLGWYLPVLLVAGCVSGAVIGAVGAVLIARVPRK